MTTTNKLRALLDAIDAADSLHEEQALALEFAGYGRKLLDVVEAANSIRQREDIGGYGYEGIPDLIKALDKLEEEDV